jgi:phosphopantothenate--cysteine ligase
MNILITAGGTSEPIDAVRVITNYSTGETGVCLADYFAAKGARVTLLRAANAMPATHSNVQTRSFTTTASYHTALYALLDAEPFDMVIHAAAISDYHVGAICIDGVDYPARNDVKLPSSSSTMALKLERNPKFINQVKRWAQNPDMLLVGFKLTQGVSDDVADTKIQRLFEASRADFVVHNDLAAVTTMQHPFRLVSANGEVRRGHNKPEMAAALFSLMEHVHDTCA